MIFAVRYHALYESARSTRTLRDNAPRLSVLLLPFETQERVHQLYDHLLVRVVE